MSKVLMDFLNDRLNQLYNRVNSIEIYVENKNKFAGDYKRDFSLDMIPAIEKEIAETEAAITGIILWKKAGSPLNKKACKTDQPKTNLDDAPQRE